MDPCLARCKVTGSRNRRNTVRCMWITSAMQIRQTTAATPMGLKRPVASCFGMSPTLICAQLPFKTTFHVRAMSATQHFGSEAMSRGSHPSAPPAFCHNFCSVLFIVLPVASPTRKARLCVHDAWACAITVHIARGWWSLVPNPWPFLSIFLYFFGCEAQCFHASPVVLLHAVLPTLQYRSCCSLFLRSLMNYIS